MRECDTIDEKLGFVIRGNESF